MTTGRMKQKYNARPTAREKDYHLWLMEAFTCVCCCEGQATVVHHPLTRHPEQRWRRDHEYVVPMTDACHRAIHAHGSEPFDFGELAAQYRSYGYDAGKL